MPTFNESYYRDKFNKKRAELFRHLEKKPDDLVAKEKIQFINNLLREGNESSWPTIWREWEKNKFFWISIKKGN